MGYETQLIVGKVSTLESDKGIYFQVYATIDMCKLGDSALFSLDWVCPKSSEENETVYFYPPCEGNTMIKKDQYGDMPKPIPIKDVVQALEVDIKNSDYRRLKWAHALLKSMENEKDGLSVLLWGY